MSVIRSYDQPSVDLTKVLISAPRVFAATYNSSTPPTYNGEAQLAIATPPTTGAWVDVGIVEAVQVTVDKNLVHAELGRPKTKRKSVEIKRDTKVAFVQKEFPIESLALIFGLQAKNKLTGSVATLGGSPTKLSITLGGGEGAGFVAGDRVVVASAENGLIDSHNRAIVKSVSTDTLTLVGTGFPSLPAAGYKLKKYFSCEMVDLMDSIQERSLLVFFDWLEEGYNRQIALFFPRMSVGKGFNPDLKGGDNFADAQAELESLTTTQTLTDGSAESVHCILYYFD